MSDWRNMLDVGVITWIDYFFYSTERSVTISGLLLLDIIPGLINVVPCRYSTTWNRQSRFCIKLIRTQSASMGHVIACLGWKSSYPGNIDILVHGEECLKASSNGTECSEDLNDDGIR